MGFERFRRGGRQSTVSDGAYYLVNKCRVDNGPPSRGAFIHWIWQILASLLVALSTVHYTQSVTEELFEA